MTPSVLSPLRRLSRLFRIPIVLAAAVLAPACVPPPPSSDAWDAVREETSSPVPEVLPLTRQGRYTLVELAPEAAQRDLLRQLVEISIPPTLAATVGEALRHLLRHSGYRLCETPDAALDGLPLPAAHRRLGPMTLRDALLTLAGPAWKLSVDDFSRQVCFTRRSSGLPETPETSLSDGRRQP
jgi:type IV pili sensor histidine kinase/response regulator